MPSINLDLTAMHAPKAKPGGDLIVVDDRTVNARGYAEAVAGGLYRVNLCASTRALEALLSHPPDQFNPVAALVDLDLGDGNPSGLDAVRILTRHERTRHIVPALNTNALRSAHREILAVLCAEVAECPLPMATQEDDQISLLRTYISAVQQSAAAGDRQVRIDGLDRIHPVTIERGPNKTPPTRSLWDLLAGRRWKQTFWAELVRTRSIDDAHAMVKDTYRRHPSDYNASIHIDDMQANRRAMLKNDLGLLPLALDVNGGSFLHLPDGTLRLEDAHDFRTAGRLPRGTALVAFAEKYAAALTEDDLYVELAE